MIRKICFLVVCTCCALMSCTSVSEQSGWHREKGTNVVDVPERPAGQEQAIELPAPPPAAQPLTERDAEVLTLIAGGLINKQVADRLGIGLTTVISHRRNIMEKLGIRTAAGLVVYALAAGYVDPDGM